MRRALLLLAVVACLGMTGCAVGYGLQKVENPTSLTNTVSQDESVIVFYRSLFTGGTPALLLEVTDGNLQFVTIVSIGTKIVHKTSPGKHIYLMHGGFGYFLDAELEGGKTYYAYVSRRPGWGRDRFVFEPVMGKQLETGDFKDVFYRCDWYENTPESEQIFLNIKPELEQRYRNLIQQSAAEGWAKAAKMRPEYGITSPIK